MTRKRKRHIQRIINVKFEVRQKKRIKCVVVTRSKANGSEMLVSKLSA